MRRVKRYTRPWLLCSLLLTASLLTASLSAADAVVRGVVTDQAGKPIRGAMVKVTIGTMTVTGFTQSNGRFEITAPAGTHTVSAEAFGFGLSRQSKDTTQAGDVNFKLSPRADIARLSGAEMEGLLPHTPQAEEIKQCKHCHGFRPLTSKGAGWTAKQWHDFLPTMSTRKLGSVGGAPRPELTAALEAFFGPDGMWGPNAEPLDLSKVQYTPMKDEALRATIKEWTIPTPSHAHSVTVDDTTGMVWWGEYDVLSNQIGQFNPETETFKEFPIPVAKSMPHTGTVLSDGGYVVATSNGGKAKLAGVDRAGKMTIYDWPGKPDDQETRTARLDRTGKTVWVVAGPETWAWDVATKTFKAAYKNPVPATFPVGSQAALTARPGQKPSGNGYEATGDSKGIAWISQYTNGTLIRLDPKTGETKSFHTPEMRSVRGIAVDAEDNVWWADFDGHKIGKLDTKTGAIKLYQPPTPFASPYGVTPDYRRGHIWFADTMGNNITRFDPKTEQFLEFPLPTLHQSVRFTGVDAKGRAWYGGYWTGKLGVIDPEGPPTAR